MVLTISCTLGLAAEFLFECQGRGPTQRFGLNSSGAGHGYHCVLKAVQVIRMWSQY